MNQNVAVAKQTQLERQNQTMLPSVDVVEDGAGILLYADMPGVPKDKMSLHVEADTLTVEGEVSVGTPPEMEMKHVEMNHSHYRRVFTLSKELDTDKVNAEYKQGVLVLRIPKAEQAKARRVKIKVK